MNIKKKKEKEIQYKIPERIINTTEEWVKKHREMEINDNKKLVDKSPSSYYQIHSKSTPTKVKPRIINNKPKFV